MENTIIDKKELIDNYRLFALKSALKLETLGMQRKGPSAYSIVKNEFGLRGSKISVYKQFCAILAEIKSGN